MFENKLQLKQNNQGGFSLIEMLFYVALLSVVSAVSILTLISLDDLFASYKAEQLVFRSATTVLERIIHAVRAADTVTSAVNTAPGSLTLSSAAGTTVFATSGSGINVTEDGTDMGPLTDTNVVVNDVRFFGYDNGATEFVRVRLTLSATVGETTVSRTFNAGALLRGSYD